jgi:hypothetical protein
MTRSVIASDSEAIQNCKKLDCFGAVAPRNDVLFGSGCLKTESVRGVGKAESVPIINIPPA